MATYNVHAMQKEHKHLLRRAREVNFQIRRDPRLQQEVEAFRKRLWKMIKDIDSEVEEIVDAPIGTFGKKSAKTLHALNKGLSKLSNVAEQWVEKLAV